MFRSQLLKFSVGIVFWLQSGSAVQAWAVDDSDLSGANQLHTLTNVPLELHPDRIETVNPNGPFKLEFVRENRGKLDPISSLPLKIQSQGASTDTQTDRDGGATFADCNQSVHVETVLKNQYFEVTNGSDNYKITADVPCQGTVQLVFHSDSSGGQALGIWEIAQRAKDKLEAEIGLRFWNSQLSFVWPEEGDYYSFGQVHITRGDHWDVVGHEMGHGIYDIGSLGAFGGGMHKIDECYSEELALSEGWASFFSGWVNVDLNDADAKFEFMVPRRAPIRFENIPADVCKGETNEWRVTGFFWDLVDLHDDGEKSQMPFSKMWNALKGSKVSSASSARAKLEQAGFDRTSIQILWDLNFAK